MPERILARATTRTVGLEAILPPILPPLPGDFVGRKCFYFLYHGDFFSTWKFSLKKWFEWSLILSYFQVLEGSAVLVVSFSTSISIPSSSSTSFFLAPISKSCVFS